jgi:prevent-host-death family protein
LTRGVFPEHSCWRDTWPPIARGTSFLKGRLGERIFQPRRRIRRSWLDFGPISGRRDRAFSLLDRGENGEEIVITRRGKPVAKLAPAGLGFDRAKARRAVQGLLEASRGVTLGGLKVKDLINPPASATRSSKAVVAGVRSSAKHHVNATELSRTKLTIALRPATRMWVGSTTHGRLSGGCAPLPLS